MSANNKTEFEKFRDQLRQAIYDNVEKGHDANQMLLLVDEMSAAHQEEVNGYQIPQLGEPVL